MKTVAMLLLIGLAAGSVAAQTPPVVRRPEQPATATAAEKPTCHRQEVTGSLVGERVCHTRAEWALIDDQQRDAAKHRMTSVGSEQRPN